MPDRLVEQHYRSQRLRADAMRRLIAMAAATEVARAGASANSNCPGERRPSRRAVLAGVLAAAAAGALAASVPRSLDRDTDRARAVASEVALNHLKNLQSEFRTSDYSQLAASMVKLDFRPADSAELGDMELVGGRYCSVNDSIAAQLKLRAGGGEVATLYETRWTPWFAGLSDRTIEVDGVAVRFWREQDLLFALASGSASP